MKLELKHLAPYLPYGLKIEAERWSYTFGQHQKNIAVITTDLLRLFQEDYYNTFFPILHPLSDLVNYYNEICYKLMDARNPTNYAYSKFEVDLVVSNGVMFDTYNGFVNWLYENNFDVFGLIKAGLAIDINTLESVG